MVPPLYVTQFIYFVDRFIMKSQCVRLLFLASAAPLLFVDHYQMGILIISFESMSKL